MRPRLKLNQFDVFLTRSISGIRFVVPQSRQLRDTSSHNYATYDGRRHHEAAEHYRSFFRAYATYVAETFPNAEDIPTLDPDSIDDSEFAELIDSDDVAIFHDPVKGIGFYTHYAEVEGAHRQPPEHTDAPGVEAVRSYLDDETIPAYLLQSLAEAYPDSVDELYRLVLDQPDFSWRDDGEALLNERKPASYADRYIPDLVLLPEIALEAMRGVHGRAAGAGL
jgi:hypothetical protein